MKICYVSSAALIYYALSYPFRITYVITKHKESIKRIQKEKIYPEFTK